MPDYRETLEKLRTTVDGVCRRPIDKIQYDADGACVKCYGDTDVHLLRDALTLLTEQDAELARAKATANFYSARAIDNALARDERDAELATLRAENARLKADLAYMHGTWESR